MALIYAGIDEAGFGPMLGPLCVGLAAVRVEGWSAGDEAPDLWDRLDAVVARGLKGAAGRVVVADSKALKLPNGGTRHPLTHLERGVLTFWSASGQPLPEADDELFDRVGSLLAAEPWYGGEPAGVPVTCDADRVGIDGNLLASALRSASVGVASLACSAVAEPRFNEIVRDAGKGATTIDAIAGHARHVRTLAGDGDAVRIVCDRLGGRTRYAAVIDRLFPGSPWRVLAEHARGACYELEDDGPPTRVVFQVEAEKAHLPVALASMLAKYVREMAMARFNRYWSARVVGLKPTAGYVSDARRWLADAGDAVRPEERRAMVRLA